MRRRRIDFANGAVRFEEVKRVQIESGFGLFRCRTGSVRGDAPTGICRPAGARLFGAVTRLAAWAGIGTPLWGYWSACHCSSHSSGSPKAMFCKKRRLAPPTGLAWYPARHVFVHQRCSVSGRPLIACAGWRHVCPRKVFSIVSGRIPFREGRLPRLVARQAPSTGDAFAVWRGLPLAIRILGGFGAKSLCACRTGPPVPFARHS